MNKTELIKAVSKETKVDEAIVRNVLNSMVDTIKATLFRGYDVKIKDFIHFSKEVRMPMKRRNPQNGDLIMTKKHFYIKTSLPKVFKEKIKEQTVY